MSRPLRIEYPGAYYHVMNRGAAFQAIFADDEDRNTFLDGLGEVSRRWEAKVFCYCLMNNHYHLALQTREIPLSRIMRHIDGVYTQRFNRRKRRDGPLFRGRYRAILVEGDQYLLSLGRYIHYNPVDAGLTKSPEQYRWSSLRHYLDRSDRPDWLETDFLLGYFGGNTKGYLEFMLSKANDEVRKFYGAKLHGPILGSESFKNWIKRRRWKTPLDREVPQRRHLRPEMNSVIKAVSRGLGGKESDILKRQRGVRNEAREIGMYLCREVGGFSHREIADKFSVGSYSTVSSMCALVRKRMMEDDRLEKRIRKIRRMIQNNYGQQAT